ncbi:hypothetical protein AB9P05_22370 [Roseivirga sp. BDSF3-8]|uniref:hypothetical protein n=1 Tax=Roseivirga sp. BDSF3-8 TaxID=3241598 RepID=UPI0035318115
MKFFSTRMLMACLAGMFFFASCQQEEEVIPGNTPAPVDATMITDQLNATQSALTDGNEFGLKLLSYEFIGSVEDVARVQNEITDEDAIIPVYEGVTGDNLMNGDVSFTLKSFREAAATASQRKDGQGTVANPQLSIRSYLNDHLQQGQGLVRLNWESAEGPFSSVAVYDQEGLVYDNLLANIFTVEEAMVKDGAEAQRAQAIYRYTVVNIGLNWIWGSSRGQIYIRHDVNKSGSTVLSNGGYTSAHLNIGSADAQVKPLSIMNNTARLAWAYGYATPGASFSISFNYSIGKFETSVSGIGTKAANSGVDIR